MRHYLTDTKASRFLLDNGIKLTRQSIFKLKKSGKVPTDMNGNVCMEELIDYVNSSDRILKHSDPSVARQDEKKLEKNSLQRLKKKKVVVDKPLTYRRPKQKKLTPEELEEKEAFEAEEKVKDEVFEKNINLQRAYSFKRLQGQAMKAITDARRAKLSYEAERDEYISKDHVEHYVNTTYSTHNDRLLTIPERMTDICIALVKSSGNEKNARIKLLIKWQQELSKILESENKSIISYCKKKNIKIIKKKVKKTQKK